MIKPCMKRMVFLNKLLWMRLKNEKTAKKEGSIKESKNRVQSASDISSMTL